MASLCGEVSALPEDWSLSCFRGAKSDCVTATVVDYTVIKCEIQMNERTSNERRVERDELHSESAGEAARPR